MKGVEMKKWIILAEFGAGVNFGLWQESISAALTL